MALPIPVAITVFGFLSVYHVNIFFSKSMNDTLPCNMLHNYTLLIYNVKSIKEKLILKFKFIHFTEFLIIFI